MQENELGLSTTAVVTSSLLLLLGYQLWRAVRPSNFYRWEAAALAKSLPEVPRNFASPQALRPSPI